MDKTLNNLLDLHFLGDGRLLQLAEQYLQEFPGDREFVDICNSPMTTDYDGLEDMLINRSEGMLIRSRSIPDTDDNCELYYEPYEQ